jgi:uncharacterized low-complexity protein
MEKKKSILNGSLVAGVIIAVSGYTANAAGMFNYNNMGTGEEVRTNLLNKGETGKNFELKCGEKGKTDTAMKKGKDGKCGEGKCGDKKKDTKAPGNKKGKDGKCGATKKDM